MTAKALSTAMSARAATDAKILRCENCDNDERALLEQVGLVICKSFSELEIRLTTNTPTKMSAIERLTSRRYVFRCRNFRIKTTRLRILNKIIVNASKENSTIHSFLTSVSIPCYLK